MEYFVTGATGFIGKRLVKKLLARPDSIVHFLTRSKDPEKIDALYAFWGVDKTRAMPVVGDLKEKQLGVSKAEQKKLKGKIDHFFHLAALYDLGASAEEDEAVNIAGTRNTLTLAEALEVRCFHHMSSIAAAGMFEGIFREDMFEEAENLEHPYFRTKHEAEGIVRYVRREASGVTRTFPIEVAIANPDAAIPAGMSAEIKLAIETDPAIFLPRTAITLDVSGALGVRVLSDDNVVSFLTVTIVDDTSRGLAIAGIEPGTRIIVSGQDMVSDGQTVDAVPADDVAAGTAAAPAAEGAN